MNITALISSIDATDAEIEVSSNIDDPPHEWVIAQAEVRLGTSFTPLYRAFLAYCGGMVVEVTEDVWARDSSLSARPFWTYQYGFLVFGVGEDIPTYLDVVLTADQVRRQSGRELTPFLRQMNAPDFYCFDPQGNVCFWQHDEPHETQPVKGDFVTTVVDQIDQLQRNKARIGDYLRLDRK